MCITYVEREKRGEYLNIYAHTHTTIYITILSTPETRDDPVMIDFKVRLMIERGIN